MEKIFHRNPLKFRIHADFEADNEIINFSIGDRTTNIYEQNAFLNEDYIESELDDILQKGFYKSHIRYNNMGWFVNEVIKLENKMVFFFKDTKKDIIMTENEEEDYRNNVICRFCETNIEPDKVRDHCHSTKNFRGPAHNTCNTNVTQKQINFIPFFF